jgi:hypothetical protein
MKTGWKREAQNLEGTNSRDFSFFKNMGSRLGLSLE